MPGLLYDKVFTIMQRKPEWSNKELNAELNRKFRIGKSDCKGILHELTTSKKLTSKNGRVTLL
jgi:hypothetical protein